MGLAADLATVAAMSDAEVTAVAYTEAARGDTGQALRWAVEDLIALEARLAEAQRAVSHGYVRAGTAQA